MSRLQDLLIGVLLCIALVAAGWMGVHHYGAAQYDAGRAAAVAAGERLRQAETEQHRETETNLRTQLAARDAAAYRKEQEYASNLEAAQRRVRAGTDRLRCPASTVQPASAAGDRPAAAGPQPDGQGAELVPDVAAALLSDGATVAGLVRKFDRLTERFEACRAINAQ